MKRLLSVVLIMTLLAAVTVGFVPSAAAADDTLVVTAGDQKIELKVGEEFLYTALLYAGEKRICNGQGRVVMDSSYLEVDPYGEVDEEGEVDYVGYSFPRVKKIGVIYNVKENVIHFNFSTSTSIAAMKNAVLLKFRMKALKAGVTDLSTVMDVMINVDNDKVFFDSIPHMDIRPYITDVLEKTEGLIGDANADCSVNIRDVTAIQRICAGTDDAYVGNCADANRDGIVSLKDALALQRYIAGEAVNEELGVWIFASEE